MSLISMRVTLMPQGEVASSTTSQQPVVDLVALGQRLVEVHGPTTVRMLVMVRLIIASRRLATSYAALARIEHLVEHDGVDADHGVVLGDDFLARHVEHLLHHVDATAHIVEEAE